MKYLLTVTLLSFIFQGCLDNPFKQKAKSRPAEGKPLTENYYTAEKIGWSITLPGKEWNTKSTKENEKDAAEGRKIIKESSGIEIDDSQKEYLISFKKDNLSSFDAGIAPCMAGNSYDDMLTAMHEVIKDGYASQHIIAEYEIEATRIDGIMVDKFNIKLFTPDKRKIIVYQHLFSCLVNNHILSVNISSNNKQDEEALLNVMYSSKFSIKK